MFLLPIDTVKPHINDYYLEYCKGSELLGFIPCSSANEGHSRYFSVETECGRVVPVFYVPDMLFISEPKDATPGPALYFMGCDDGSTGMKFESKEAALQWIKDCPYAEFEEFFLAQYEFKVKLEYHN